MRRLLLSCVLLVSVALVGASQSTLISYSSQANETSSGVLNRAVGVEGQGVTRVGLSPAPGENFSSQGFTTDRGTDPAQYLEFSLTGSGIEIEVTQVQLAYARSLSGPTGVTVRSSIDTFRRDLFTDPEIPQGNRPLLIDNLSLTSADTITFRVYGFRASDEAGTLTILPINDLDANAGGVIVTGNIEQPNPVEFLGFMATPAESGAYLEWQVASELNNDYFSLEVSRDAERFEEVDRLVGRGTAETEATYSYTYKAFTSGTYYFRLRQVDFDGTESFSEVVPLNVQGRKGFSVIANATQSILSLEVEGARDFRIISLTGEVVQSTPSLSGLVDVDVSNLPSGMYLLTDGTTTTRFVR